MNFTISILLIIFTSYVYYSETKKSSIEIYNAYINEGWKNLEYVTSGFGNVSNSKLAGLNALKLDSMRIEAYTLLGWSCIIDSDIHSSLFYFRKGENKIGVNSMFKVGYSYVLNKMELFNESNMQLIGLSDVSTPYNIAINLNTIALLKAKNFFAVGDYKSALNEVKEIDSSIDIDISTIVGIIKLSELIMMLDNKKKI